MRLLQHPVIFHISAALLSITVGCSDNWDMPSRWSVPAEQHFLAVHEDPELLGTVPSARSIPGDSGTMELGWAWAVVLSPGAQWFPCAARWTPRCCCLNHVLLAITNDSTCCHGHSGGDNSQAPAARPTMSFPWKMPTCTLEKQVLLG